MTRRWTIPLAASIAVHGGMLAGLIGWCGGAAVSEPEIVLRPWEGDGAPMKIVLDGEDESGRSESGYAAPAELLKEIGIGAEAESPAGRDTEGENTPGRIEPPVVVASAERPAVEPVLGPSAPAEAVEANSAPITDVLDNWARVAAGTERAAGESVDRLRLARADVTALSNAAAERLVAAARWIDNALKAVARFHEKAKGEPPGRAVSSVAASGASGGLERARVGGVAGASRGPSAATSNRPPKYPAECRRRREQGTVMLHVVVEPDGAVSNVRLARSCGHVLLDEAALEAVRTWTFTPASVDGASVRSEVDLPIVFVIRE